MLPFIDLIGQVLDEKYKIEKQLGQGGMGAVYLATHLGTGRLVALKVIMPQFMNNDEFVERFKREARATGLLRHPNVVNVTDFGFASSKNQRIAYLVMEYLNGVSLRDFIEDKGHLPLDLTIDIVEQLCLAIEQAHKQGIVHRDLKPDNIWLEPNGRGSYNIKVLDFGLAKICDTEKPNTVVGSENVGSLNDFKPENSEDQIISGSDNTSSQETLTQTGKKLGTPTYMSPEQCLLSQKEVLVEEITFKSDIYSLGVIVYEILGGEPPFKGIADYLIAQHIYSSPPDITEKFPKINPQIAKLIMSALAKKPDERPRSAIAFGSAFRAYNETVVDMLRHTVSFYSNHLPTFATISFLAHSFLLLFCLLSLVFIFINPINFPILWVLLIVYGVASISFAAVGNIVCFAILVEKLIAQPLLSVNYKMILTDLGRALNLNFDQSAYSYLRLAWKIVILLYQSWPVGGGIINPFYFPVVVLENKNGIDLKKRTKELADFFGNSLLKLQTFSFLCFVGMSCISIFATYGFTKAVSLLWPLPITAFLGISLVFLSLPSVILYPILASAVTLVYFKARRCGGEASSANFSGTPLP